MSIPAVHFKGQQRGTRPRNIPPPLHSRRSNPQIRTIEFSSDSDYDLPVIKTKPNPNYVDLAEISDNDSDSDNISIKKKENQSQDSDEEQNQVDWGSKKSTSQLHRKSYNPPPSRPNQQISPQYSGSDSIQVEKSPLNSESNQSNASNSDSVHHKVRRRVRKVTNNNPINPSPPLPPQPPQTAEPEPNSDKDYSNKRVHRHRSLTTQPVNQTDNRQMELNRSSSIRKTNVTTHVVTKTVDLTSHDQTNSMNHPIPSKQNKPIKKLEQPENEFASFTVVKEAKRTTRKAQSDYRIMQNENALYFAKSFKDEIGQHFDISRSLPVMEGSADNVAILRKQHHGARYTVYVNSDKINDDRDAEMLGMAFVKIPEIRTKQKMFRVSIKNNCEINYPVSKRRELSRIAEDLNANFDGIVSYLNQPPLLDAEGNAIDQFGGMFVVDSQKNYVICNEANQPIFMIFKSSEASFSVKIKYPFNVTMAFGLSIAIIEECS